MIERLIKLIQTYQARVQAAVLLFEKYKGINLRTTPRHNLPQSGFLDPDRRFKYFFHGIGCEVTFPGGIVDWDFYGIDRRIDGFWEKHLRYFAEKGTNAFPEFRQKDTFNKIFRELESQGLIQLQLDIFGGPQCYLLTLPNTWIDTEPFSS